MERLSVVIPCHDNAAHVAAAIDSVLGQTWAPDEVIVVDDGSADASVKEIGRFASEVRLIRQPNRGAAAARNRGIVEARGELIAFLDGDDIWPADSLALRVEAMCGSGADIVFGRVRQCLGEAGEQVPAFGDEIVGRLAGAMLVRRAVFDRIGPFDEALKTAETIDWVARAQEAGVRAASCDALVLFRRIHATNMMRTHAAPERNCLAVLRSAVERRRAATA